MTTGISAAMTVTLTGGTASPNTAEVDLATDPTGDLLTIDPAGDVLMVSAAITFTGGTASFVVPDFSTALETEGWVGLGLEDGRAVATEGS